MITLTSAAPARLSVDALVVGVTADADGPRLLGDALPAALASAITAKGLGITGEAGQVVRVPSAGAVAATVVAVVGVADPADPEALRRAAGAATRQLAGLGSVAIALPTPDVAALAAVAEGALLGAYAYTAYRTGTVQAPVATIQVATSLAKQSAAKDAVVRAEVVAAAVHGVRDLVNMPPRDLFPQAFADIAKAATKGTKIKISVLDEKELAAQGFGGIVAVGQGSVRPPRLVKVTYSPGRTKKHVALVGKGITFDSGGLSLKPAKSMETMKSDMAGAATVLHTVLAAAALKLPVQVTGWLCLAENMPSGSAQRPSDVITQRGGTTVEVLNTDAEGRLVLADGLVAAVEEKPTAVLDIATLTGAQVVALGSRVSGVMGTEDLRAAVVRAADESGELMWPMPLPDELRATLTSQVADLANVSGDRTAGMLTAGVFLREFVGSTPWAHLDVAGPAFNEGAPWGYTPKGGTGVAVRTLLRLLETI